MAMLGMRSHSSKKYQEYYQDFFQDKSRQKIMRARGCDPPTRIPKSTQRSEILQEISLPRYQDLKISEIARLRSRKQE